MKNLIDKIIEEFSRSNYPLSFYRYSDERFEIEIRVPHSYPIDIISFIKSPEFNKSEHGINLLRICPAIELICIKDPSLRNQGIFNYLVSGLLELDTVHYVIVQNVHSKLFAFSLFESARWQPIVYKECFDDMHIKKIIPLIKTQPEQAKKYLHLLQNHLDKLGEEWCKETIESINRYTYGELCSELTEEGLIGIENKNTQISSNLSQQTNIMFQLENMKDKVLKIEQERDKATATEIGETLTSLYGKTIIDRFFTTNERFNLKYK